LFEVFDEESAGFVFLVAQLWLVVDLGADSGECVSVLVDASGYGLFVVHGCVSVAVKINALGWGWLLGVLDRSLYADIRGAMYWLCMRVAVLHGSPRRGGNSDTLVEHFLRGLRESGGHEMAHFYLNEMEIRPCHGCLGCAVPPHECVIRDDMPEIYGAYRGADLVVWPSPMYWGYLTGQLKVVQDRMEALAWSGFGGKIFAVIITYRHPCESAAAMFERICPYFSMEPHTLVCRTFDPAAGRDVPVGILPGKLEEAYRLGRAPSGEPGSL